MNDEPETYSLPKQEGAQDGQRVEQPRREAPPFYGAEEFPPSYVLQQETSAHRAICLLFAQGFTISEVAAQTGYTPACVAYVKKQPWALRFVAEMQGMRGGEAIKRILEGGAADAAKLIVGIVRDKDVRIDVRAKEANNLLNRLYGAAPQVHMHGRIDPTEVSDEELLTIASGAA